MIYNIKQYCNYTKNTGNNLEINGILSNNNKQESHLSILDINQIQKNIMNSFSNQPD